EPWGYLLQNRTRTLWEEATTPGPKLTGRRCQELPEALWIAAPVGRARRGAGPGVRRPRTDRNQPRETRAAPGSGRVPCWRHPGRHEARPTRALPSRCPRDRR